MAAANGISYVDPDTGYTMTPGTQRPDGTWRKPRRVKEGYTPQDEVPLYESKGKQIAKARAGEHGIPGLCTSPINYKIDMFVIPPPVITIPGLSVDTTTPSSSSTSSTSKVKKKKNKAVAVAVANCTSMENGVGEVTAKMAGANLRQQPVATDPAKKLRNLRKKLRDIEALEAKIEGGEIENPEKEQLEKVAKKVEVAREIANLEKIVE